MSEQIDLAKLAEPFPAEDIKWRVAQAGIGKNGTWCRVIPFVTARAIQARFDEVCGIGGWKNEEPRVIEFHPGKFAFVCGLSIRIGSEWITKWGVAEPTPERGMMVGTSAKGGDSGSQKRAGAQWGAARYLYYIDPIYAEVADQPLEGSRNWNYAKLPKDQGGAVYYWKTPSLPAWALPKEPEHAITLGELNDLKRTWAAKFAPDTKNPKDLREGFTRLVTSIVGEFPAADYTCWTRDALEQCQKRIAETTDPNGVSADVPFEE